MSQTQNASNRKLTAYMSPAGAWAFSVGTSIGWGSFVVTCSTYLGQAGIHGTVFGLLAGMIVVLVVAKNLYTAIEHDPDSGGIYTYVRSVCGHDHGFLIAWFLLLTYLAILWANITSIPLFARNFMGNMFMFGRMYSIFGYDVYAGEVMIAIVFVAIVALLCANSTRIPQIFMIVMAVLFIGILIISAVLCFIHHDASYSFEPGYVPDRSHLTQIVRIAVISPWAFIGFENIAHFSEEIRYPVTKTRRILISSVLFTTLVYILMTLLSVSAYPPGYATWLDYIRDMGNLSGIESIPAFYAASVYMGNTGVNLMMLALLCVVFTSIIGNLTAVSRLIYALGRDGIAPASCGNVTSKGIPARSVIIVMLISFLIPFMGRTAIGWIVDVTTLGATILYGFLSYAVLRDAKRRGDRGCTISGAVGAALMIGFVILLLAPKLMTYEAMPSESYFIFAVWSLLGLIVFRIVMNHDDAHVFGRSVVVWMLFLLLILLTTMMWVNRETQTVTDDSLAEIRTYYEGHIENGGASYDSDEAEEFMRLRAERIEGLDSRNTIFSYGLFLLAVLIMLDNFRISRNREKEWQDELGKARKETNTDPLTGVKNRHAFFEWQENIENRIESGDRRAFAVVVCDVNDLKRVNDTLGHEAGDECIRTASARICRIFSHSPVFRFGGDEFVVILEGEDYDRNEELMAQLAEYSKEAPANNENSIAAGIALYDPDRHSSMHAVFEAADTAMYAQKKIMKGRS